MIVAANRNAFGTSCARCRSHLIAPIRSNYLHERIVKHEWYCECCDLTFATSARFGQSHRCDSDAEKAAA